MRDGGQLAAGSAHAAVVGGGPAGLAAATWLSRYRRRVVLVDSARPRNAPVEHSHGYLGMDPVAPGELRRRALRELDRYPSATRVDGRVDSVKRAASGGFRLVVGERTIEAARVVLATGVAEQVPDIAGFSEHYGRSVFHCPACDGYEARNEHIVVIGWHADVVGFSLDLLDWASSVTLVTDGHPLEVDDADEAALAGHAIELVRDKALEFVGGEGALQGVRLASGRQVACQRAFFTIQHRPVVDLAVALGCEQDDDGYVRVDSDGQTSVAGAYAAGDCTAGLQLVQVAAGEGATAGVACALSLRTPLHRL